MNDATVITARVKQLVSGINSPVLRKLCSDVLLRISMRHLPDRLWTPEVRECQDLCNIIWHHDLLICVTLQLVECYRLSENAGKTIPTPGASVRVGREDRALAEAMLPNLDSWADANRNSLFVSVTTT
jgi:hypothetical protein